MASTTASGLITNLANYQGEWIGIGQRKYPFSSLLGMGALERGEESPFREVGAMHFNMSQSYSLDSASQPSHSENSTFNSATSTVYQTTQNTNYCQVMREGVRFSDLKLSDRSISGNAIDGDIFAMQEFQKQIMIHLEQMKRDFEFSIINGVGADGSSDPATAFQVNGLYTALSTNKIDASAVAISKPLIESLAESMLDNGADMEDMYFMCRSNLLMDINTLYGVQPRSESRGGINLLELVIPGMPPVKLVYNDLVPSGVLLAVDMGHCEGVSNTTPGLPQISFRSTANVGQGEIGEVFAKIGIDFGHESKHGALYNLSV